MKNYEVGIIVGVIALIGFFWYKNSEGTPNQQPIGNVKFVGATTPTCAFSLTGSIPMTLSNLPAPGSIDTTMISASTELEQP